VSSKPFTLDQRPGPCDSAHKEFISIDFLAGNPCVESLGVALETQEILASAIEAVIEGGLDL